MDNLSLREHFISYLTAMINFHESGSHHGTEISHSQLSGVQRVVDKFNKNEIKSIQQDSFEDFPEE